MIRPELLTAALATRDRAASVEESCLPLRSFQRVVDTSELGSLGADQARRPPSRPFVVAGHGLQMTRPACGANEKRILQFAKSSGQATGD